MTRLSVLLLASVLLSCEPAAEKEDPVRTLPQRLTWNAQRAASVATDSLLPRTGPEALAGVVKVHTLEFREDGNLTVILREFRKDWQAFAAFQTKASAEELRQGFYREKNSFFFYHGPYLGEVRSEAPALMPSAYLRDRLAFHPEEPFLRPQVFRTFPLSGQIPHSERVLTPAFLGKKGSGTLVAMSFQCGADTASLFRGIPPFENEPGDWIRQWQGKSDTLKWSGEVHFSGLLGPEQPLNFWKFKGGFRGILGCFDPIQAAEYGEKMKKMEVLLPNP
jgi:hypothetical protein